MRAARFDRLDRQILRDEDEARQARAGAASADVPRRMDHVMDAIERHRARPAGDIEKSLESQHFLAMRVQEQREPDRERATIRPAVEHDRNARDPASARLGTRSLADDCQDRPVVA